MVSSSKSRRGRAAAAIGSVTATAMAAVTRTAESSASSRAIDSAAGDLEVQAYVYTYPLVSVEVSRRQATNYPVPDPSIGAAPMNQLAHLHFLPGAGFTDVVRPNVDTVYTSMFFDVSTQPLVVSVPDMSGRYHLFPIMDMWSNVDASAGPRTLDDQHGYQFAIVGPDFAGTLPAGVHEYRLPTDAGWMIGRIQVDGPEDLPGVIALQDRMSAVPLGSYGSPYTPPTNTEIHTDWQRVQVAEYIHDLTPQQYWDLYYAALSHAQTRPGDEVLLAELASIGWRPDTALNLASLPESERTRWEQAWPTALSQIERDMGNTTVNGWTVSRTGVGDYGTAYADRAVVAYAGLGANLPQDAIYPSTRLDDTGAQLSADNNYVLHFPADQKPPVTGFWSLTMYNDSGFFVDNPINRYAVRGEHLRANSDGSLDIHIQRETPGTPRESNWLPAPASGEFNLMLRLYWPDQAVIDGNWNPPPVTRTDR